MNWITNESGKYIDVIYQLSTNLVGKMVFEHYDRPEYRNTIIFVNSYFELPVYDKSKDKIYYQLEHLTCMHPDHVLLWNWVRENNIKEIWEFSLENLRFYPSDLISKVKCRPLRYCSYYEDILRESTNQYDYFFTGVFETDYRKMVFDMIQDTWQLHKYKLIFGECIQNMLDDVYSCRYILDFAHSDPSLSVQNSVRIFEFLCLDCTVVRDDYGFNQFYDLIYNIPLQTIFYGNLNLESIHPADKYKQLTYDDQAYYGYIQGLINSYSNYRSL